MGTAATRHDNDNDDIVYVVPNDQVISVSPSNQVISAVPNDQRALDAPSGPCLLCGRPSEYASPFKEDAFECEFQCGWPVPHDIRERLCQVKEQEERRDAELYGYEADDEQEDGAQDTAELRAGGTVHDGGPTGGEMDELPSQAPTQNIADHHNEEHSDGSHTADMVSLHSEEEGGMTGTFVELDVDPGNVDVYEEMHKTLFPHGAPGPPIQPKKPRDTTSKALGHDNLQIASSGKRRPKDGHKGSKDRPAKKKNIVDGPSTTVSKDPTDCFRLGGRHNLLGLGRKAKPSFFDRLIGLHDNED